MRLTLVSMSGLRVGHESLRSRGLRLPGLARRANALSQLPPLGLLTIAALVDDSWDLDLIQDDGRCDVSLAFEQIMESSPDVVAFSALTASVDRACEISGRLRRRGIRTVLGGLHATAAPKSCRPHFDALVLGDGEPQFPVLLSDLRSGNLQPIYRSSGNYDLTRSPVPKWDLLGPSAPPRHTLQTMRGCPWSCSFCAASRLLGPARSKSNRQIRSELAAITDRQPRPWIELADDNTFAGKTDHEFLLSALADSGARWFTESDWRIADDPVLLQRIAASGCRQILIGMESSVFRYPGMGAKTASHDAIMDAAVAIAEAGIVVNGCFIIGADGETHESIERLGDFLELAPLGEVQLTLQTPFPGTSLYQSLKESNRLLEGDFSRYTLFDVVHQPDRMTPTELQDCFDRLIDRVYHPKQQIRRSQIQRAIRRNLNLPR